MIVRNEPLISFIAAPRVLGSKEATTIVTRGVTLLSPESLGPQHRLDSFDCSKQALNEWLVRHARQAQGSGSAKTSVVSDDDRVAGYYSLTVGQIDTLDAPERMRKGMGQYPLPMVILARLAVSRHDQGRGIGFGLLQDAIRRTLLIAEQAGIRLIDGDHDIDCKIDGIGAMQLKSEFVKKA